MKDYLEESEIELTPKMKEEIYGVSEMKKLSISKILMIASAVIIVLIVVNVWSGVSESELEFNSELKGELYQEKGIGEGVDLQINDTNETSQNNSVMNVSD